MLSQISTGLQTGIWKKTVQRWWRNSQWKIQRIWSRQEQKQLSSCARLRVAPVLLSGVLEVNISLAFRTFSHDPLKHLIILTIRKTLDPEKQEMFHLIAIHGLNSELDALTFSSQIHLALNFPSLIFAHFLVSCCSLEFNGQVFLSQILASSPP